MENKPAVFLDRDGTLVEQVDALTSPSQLKLLPGASEAVAELKRRGFLVVGITNQPIIEKGLLTQAGLDAIHEELQRQLAEAGARLDAIYTCPHKYRAEGQCKCRKPGTGLIEQAEADLPIDRARSWLVGDRLRDVQTGKNAGLKTILVATGGKSKDDEFFPDTAPDYRATGLSEATKLIK